MNPKNSLAFGYLLGYILAIYNFPLSLVYKLTGLPPKESLQPSQKLTLTIIETVLSSVIYYAVFFLVFRR